MTEFRCGAPAGRGRTCRKLLGTFDGRTLSGGYLLPDDDPREVYRFSCPTHGEGTVWPRTLKAGQSDRVVLVIR